MVERDNDLYCTIKVQVFTFEDFSVAEAEELLCSKCSITLFKSLQLSSCDARITFHVIVTNCHALSRSGGGS